MKYTEFKIKADTEDIDTKMEFMIKRCCAQIIQSLSIDELTTLFGLEQETREVDAVSLGNEKEKYIFCRLTYPKRLTKQEWQELQERLGLGSTFCKIKSLEG